MASRTQTSLRAVSQSHLRPLSKNHERNLTVPNCVEAFIYQISAIPKQTALKAQTTTTTDQVEADGQQHMTHIAVERKRRKQMDVHLAVLRAMSNVYTPILFSF